MVNHIVIGEPLCCQERFKIVEGSLYFRKVQFKGQTHFITALAQSPDGRYVLSASMDMTLQIWNPDQDQPLLSLFFTQDEWIAWTPEGYYAASPLGERLMGWYVSNGPEAMGTFYQAAKFRQSLYRPDLIKQLLTAGTVDRALETADKAAGRTSEPTNVSKAVPPKVRFVYPDKSPARVAKPKIVIKGVAESQGKHPVIAMRLIVNDRPFGPPVKIPKPALGKAVKEWPVELEPGTYSFKITAYTALGWQNSEESVVVYGKSTEPRLFMLAMGINAYPDKKNRLQCCVNDAKALESLFRQKGEGVYRSVETRLLLDKDATRQGILQGLDWLKGQMTSQDVALIFYSGHGGNDPKSGFFLCPVDVDKNPLWGTDLKKALLDIPGRVIVMLDCCHAGGVGHDPRRSLNALTGSLVRDLTSDDYGVVVMCAATSREFALEVGKLKHGVFTVALLEGLSGKADYNRDGYIHLNELDLYVSERVKQLNNRQHTVTGKPTTLRSFALTRP